MPIAISPPSRGRLAVTLAALLLLGAATAGRAQSADTDIVAQRGDVKLTVADVRDLLDHQDPALRTQLQSNPTALANFVRDRLLRMALLNDARAKGFDQLQDVIARANDARDGVIVSAYVNSLVPADPAFPAPAEISATYEANKSKFMLPRQYHLAQIAFPLPNPPSTAGDDEAKRRATEARAQAVKPRTDFADLARKLSQDRQTAPNGGDLGWVREDQLQPSIRGTVSALAEGGVAEPIRLPNAWVVLKVLGTRPPGPAPLAEVQEQLVQAMRQSRAQQASQGVVNEMLRREPIQLNEIDLVRRLAAAPAPATPPATTNP
jgi:peptidylprolyl isomerase